MIKRLVHSCDYETKHRVDELRCQIPIGRLSPHIGNEHHTVRKIVCADIIAGYGFASSQISASLGTVQNTHKIASKQTVTT